ncbi:hypothetical protein [Massilibacterium senegalense]|uniref:hypothetical protein n=1 Tax=Massilibacterium senegalense TaxID=1632858 RepID=UPI00078551CF|nr:hypothetical protein [Massilibacterium senegalense]
MQVAIVLLFIVAIVLLVLSFFKKEDLSEIHNEIDNVSIQTFQEIYQLKKRVKTLENEVLGSDEERV